MSTAPDGDAASVWLSSDLLCAFMLNSEPWFLLKLLGFLFTALKCPRISLGWVSGVSPTFSGWTKGANAHFDTASSESWSWRNWASIALVGELLSPLPLLVPPSLNPSSSSSLKISDSFTDEVERGCALEPGVWDQFCWTGGACESEEEVQGGGAPDKLKVPLLRLPSSESGPGLGFPAWAGRSPSGCLHNQEALEEPGNKYEDGSQKCYSYLSTTLAP